ncbi:hypothetical protein ACRRTK_002851 [Alexandromys fortis]
MLRGPARRGFPTPQPSLAGPGSPSGSRGPGYQSPSPLSPRRSGERGSRSPEDEKLFPTPPPSRPSPPSPS